VKNIDFSIKHRSRTGYYTVSDQQFHHYYEINYLLSGERFYFVKNRTYAMKQGEMIFIGVNDLHKTAETKEAVHERINISFREEYIHRLADPSIRELLLVPFRQETRMLRFNIHEQSFVEGLLFGMLKETQQKHSCSELYIGSLMTQLLIYTHRMTTRQNSQPFEYVSPLHKKISEVSEYVTGHYIEPLTLTGVSEHFYISPYYLSRSFKQITGFTFVEYVNNVRIKEAQRLLRETRMKVAQIAELTGFESIVHFGRVFRQITRLSPLEYRKSVLV
jgi:YesN/AraC family two-component response regulator